MGIYKNCMNTEKQVIPFSYEDKEVRTVLIEGEPWFVAKDICDILEHTNHIVALQMLDEDEKGVSKVYSLGGYQDTNVINESGLYNLIFRSNKPEAKAFRKWVTSVVLPAIRKTGYYAVPRLQERLEEAMTAIIAKPAHIDALAKCYTRLKQIVREGTRLNDELGKIINQNRLRELIPEIVHNRLGNDQFHNNLPIDLFVAERLDITGNPHDTVCVSPAYRVYMAYTETPVDEHDFSFYITDNYASISITKKNTSYGYGEYSFTGCQWRKNE